MKILLHGLNFAPEEIGIGKYSGEMITALAAAGHECVVVTTPPYYPQWQVQRPYAARKYTKQWRAVSGERREEPTQSSVSSDLPLAIHPFPVFRCPLWVPRRVNGWKRVIHLASFGLSSVPVVLWQAVRFRPDVVITVEPAAMCLPTTWLAARLCGAKAWLHVQDFEVDAAFELGILRQAWLKRVVLALERFLMRRFDRVSSISPNMLLRLAEKGVDESRIVAFPNWVDCDQMRPLESVVDRSVDPSSADISSNSKSRQDFRPGIDLPAPNVEQTLPLADARSLTQSREGLAEQSMDRGAIHDTVIHDLRAMFGIPRDKCVALCAGNIGAKQGVEIITTAAARCGDDRVHFVICGHGAAYPALQSYAVGLANVQLLPPQPLERFNELMNCGDIHLLPQRSDAADLVMPSKLTGMLATGRPVVACATPGTQIADVVASHGLVVAPGDADAFLQAVLTLASDPGLRRHLGAAGRCYAVEHLGRDAILGRFEQELKRLVKG